MLLLINRLKNKSAQWTISYDRSCVLGSGRCGTVFKGELMNKEDNTKRDAAIKRLQLGNVIKIVRRLELIQMDLDHPNVIKLLHIEEDDNFV